MKTQLLISSFLLLSSISFSFELPKNNLESVLRSMGLKSDPASLKQIVSENVDVPVIIKDREPTREELVDHLKSPDYDSPNDAGLLLMFRAPQNFSLRDCGKDAFTFSTAAANSMVHTQVLTDAQGNQRIQKVDAIGNTTEIKMEKGDCLRSLSIAIRMYELSGGIGQNFMMFPVSDSFIEKFHSSINQEDPYLRKQGGYDQYSAFLQDNRGRQFAPGEGKLYVMPIRVKYEVYKRLRETDTNRVVVSLGTSLMIPVQAPFSQAGAGVHANIHTTHKIDDNWLATFGAGIGYNIQKTVFGDSYRPTDKEWDQSNYQAIAAAVTRLNDDRKGSVSLVVSVQQTNGLINKNDYRALYNQRFVDRQSTAAATDKERGLVVALIFDNIESSHTIYCKEDFKGRGWRANGNNNEDFHCGYKYEKRW